MQIKPLLEILREVTRGKLVLDPKIKLVTAVKFVAKFLTDLLSPLILMKKHHSKIKEYYHLS